MSATIVRLVKDREHPYLMVARKTVRDHRLSLAERGFLLELLSMPDDWSISIRGLASTMKLGKNSVQRHLQALIKAGYCIRGDRERTPRGRLGGLSYTVFESPELAREPRLQSGDKVGPRCPQTQDMEIRDTTNKLCYQDTLGATQPQPDSGREKDPHSQLASLFRHRFRTHLGYPPSWTGKEGRLLRQGLSRFGSEELEWMIDRFFSDPPKDVEQFAAKAGWGYNVFHSQLDKLLADQRAQKEHLAPVRICTHCGESQAHTGLDCLRCHRPMREESRVG